MTETQTFLEKCGSVAFAIAIIGIAIVAVSLVDSRELPLTIIGAILGVTMTVLATFFLFKGQSKQQIAFLEEKHCIEREQENETEIFKQKLNAYQQFLDALCKYMTTKSDEARSELKFRTAALAIHGGTQQLTALNRRFYVVQAQGAEDDSEYSKALKMQYKSSRRSNIWWRELTSLPSYGVSNGLSTAVETNEKARAVVVKWIDRLI